MSCSFHARIPSFEGFTRWEGIKVGVPVPDLFVVATTGWAVVVATLFVFDASFSLDVSEDPDTLAFSMTSAPCNAMSVLAHFR